MGNERPTELYGLDAENGTIKFKPEWEPRDGSGSVYAEWGKCCGCGEERLCLTSHVIGDEHDATRVCDACIKQIFKAGRRYYRERYGEKV